MVTITKNTKITYKKPKNKRKFSIDESEIINKIMQEAVNIQYQLQDDDDIETMDVDAIFLHDLCVAFIAMYNKIIQENLILTGNPTGSLTLH